MRMEAVAKDGRKAVIRYAHEDLEVCVGIATAAFAMATLRGDVSFRPMEAFFFSFGVSVSGMMRTCALVYRMPRERLMAFSYSLRPQQQDGDVLLPSVVDPVL